ncbi:hypothetical protein [Asticcacaulis sp. EMRT-3]|uniref:hypothetical protein n=1 Tax=Asticcacaulis sp. EMRT-3 TaxID=3040349 RepID=UPI0024AFD13F|nr:hypothetical protein [Asticcacaulis sp. EMRT-3]MDI7774942.1 hypothetical protein [Asticcacaulis sp. EMRT-3]
MIDVIRSYHTPIYEQSRARSIPKSLYWGIGFALLLHLLLAWYLIHQTYGGMDAEPPREAPAMGVTMVTLPPPPPDVHRQPPVNRLVPHESPLPPPIVATTPLDPAVKPLTDATPLTPPVIDDAPPQVTSGPKPGPAFVTPHWTRFPDGNALASYYPPRAVDNETEGTSTVECTVIDARGRVACQAISETPEGYGFGAATARMVQDRGRVDTSQGDIRIGAKLHTTVRWTLN